MKIISLLLIILFQACNNISQDKISEKYIPIPITADSLIAKFNNTPVSTIRLNQGASSYVDTTFKNDLFIVKDTISEIKFDNTGRGYIILGRINNNKNLKCYFEDERQIDSLKVNQLITVSSVKHAAKFSSLKYDKDTIRVFVVEMVGCKKLKYSKLD